MAPDPRSPRHDQQGDRQAGCGHPRDAERPDAEQPAVPLLLCDTRALTAGLPAAGGALWKLAEPGRQLDANLVHLPPGDRVATHAEPDLDVLLLVVAGAGTVSATGLTEPLTEPLTAGLLYWLPHGSSRSIDAGPQGLSYLTVHRRRPGMRIGPRPATSGA